MDPMQMPMEEEQGQPGPDEVIIELLTELVQQGRAKRAEGVMAPPPAAPVDAPPPDDEMAELEAMLADPSAQPPPDAMPTPKKKPEDEDELE